MVVHRSSSRRRNSRRRGVVVLRNSRRREVEVWMRGMVVHRSSRRVVVWKRNVERRRDMLRRGMHRSRDSRSVDGERRGVDRERRSVDGRRESGGVDRERRSVGSVVKRGVDRERRSVGSVVRRGVDGSGGERRAGDRSRVVVVFDSNGSVRGSRRSSVRGSNNCPSNRLVNGNWKKRNARFIVIILLYTNLAATSCMNTWKNGKLLSSFIADAVHNHSDVIVLDQTH